MVQKLVDKLDKILIQPIITLLLVVATLIFIWGVIEYIAQGSSEEARIKGKKHIMWGVIGLTIMLSVYLIRGVLESFFASI